MTEARPAAERRLRPLDTTGPRKVRSLDAIGQKWTPSTYPYHGREPVNTSVKQSRLYLVENNPCRVKLFTVFTTNPTTRELLK